MQLTAGRKLQNACFENSNGRMRDEVLNEHLLDNLRYAQELIAAWRDDHIQHRPHTSLGC